MKPKNIVKAWADAFNNGDAKSLAALYDVHATNHQVANAPVVGKDAIYAMFSEEFACADRGCIAEHIFGEDEWAIVDWKDPLGLRGCVFSYSTWSDSVSTGLLGQTEFFKSP
ncbi:YybH family protein [Salinimonas lutimaris]|uniref:YybH family protein n=1 Tax=Salinimonas lutimaris TaxID=914153 RepID=UPI001E347E4A|nr:nuclear transport factor 2 family protein [Salinimonas lutimaris]